MANGGNPPPGLQWYIGGQRWDGNTEEINEETGVTVSRVKLPVTRGDDEKEVKCEVVHEALTEYLEEKAALDVHCKLLSLTRRTISFLTSTFQICLKFRCLCLKTFPIISRVTLPQFLVLLLQTPRPTFSGTEMEAGKLLVDKRHLKLWISNVTRLESMFVKRTTLSDKVIQRKLTYK